MGAARGREQEGLPCWRLRTCAKIAPAAPATSLDHPSLFSFFIFIFIFWAIGARPHGTVPMITRAIPVRAMLVSEKRFLCHSLLVTLAQEQPSPPAWCKHGMASSSPSRILVVRGPANPTRTTPRVPCRTRAACQLLYDAAVHSLDANSGARSK